MFDGTGRTWFVPDLIIRNIDLSVDKSIVPFEPDKDVPHFPLIKVNELSMALEKLCHFIRSDPLRMVNVPKNQSVAPKQFTCIKIIFVSSCNLSVQMLFITGLG